MCCFAWLYNCYERVPLFRIGEISDISWEDSEHKYGGAKKKKKKVLTTIL